MRESIQERFNAQNDDCSCCSIFPQPGQTPRRHEPQAYHMRLRANAPIREDGDAGERQDWLVDDSPSQEGILVKNEELENRRQALIQALSGLNARERRIFEARRLAEDPIPFGVLAYEIGVSGERVRQIEVLAFEKVRKAVQHRVATIERPERRHHGPQAVSHGAPCAA